MEKRTFLAIVLSIAILLAWQFFLIEPKKAEMEKQRAPAPKAQPKVMTPVQVAPTAVPVAVVPSAKEEYIVTETPLCRATWSTKGARLVSLKLKKYKESMAKNAGYVEMIHTPLPGISLSGSTTDGAFLYVPSGHGTIAVEKGMYALTFTTQLAQGVVLKKVFTIDPKSYIIGYKHMLINDTPNPLALGINLTMHDSYPADKKGSSYTFEGPVLLNGRHLEEFKLSKIKKAGTYRDFSGAIKWFGFEDKYFLKVMIPQKASETTLSIRRVDGDMVGCVYAMADSAIKPGYTMGEELFLFIGPKELNILKASGYDLSKALDFGFFDIIAKPLLMALNWIEKYIHSYGWSIIILTFIIKILLYPLSLKSFKSMKELQKVQPLMKELQEKYKDDKQKMNQALMKLYKEHKINPMGGCLPLLLQIPILFALYKVFLASIELRHTPFHIVGAWLPDLSAKDPYYITPLLMGASWFIQQKMTPSPGDPMQQKMMMIMPIIFTFMFLNFPSGLVVYWLVSNILSIIQQTYINRVHT